MNDHKPEEVHTLFAKYFNSADIEALVGLYEEDASLAPQPGQVVKGKEAIRQALLGFLALKGRMEIKTRYVMQSGEIALLSAEWHLTGTDAAGEALEMGSKTAEVARRQSDGRWLYVADHPFGSQ